MKKCSIYFLLSLGNVYSSCSQHSNYGKPIKEPVEILKDFDHYWDYQNKYVKLFENFIALDDSLQHIEKKNFISELVNGNFLPLRLNSTDSNIYYQLYRLNSSVDNTIAQTIKQMAAFDYKNYLLEGKKLPSLNFVDLEGNKYDSETTKGKTIVIKCWFIHCTKCIEEMPKLNKLVEKYNRKKDILFLSLAFDSENELRSFLAKREFKYAVVANKKDYLKKDLNISLYPTHLIINKNGIIVKVINSFQELDIALNTFLSKTN